MSAAFSLRGLLIALGIVALGLPAAFFGLYGVVTQINDFNSRVAQVREAQLYVAELQRLQSDEENSVRGFIATKDGAYRERYHTSVLEFPVAVKGAAQRLNFGPEDRHANATLREADALNARWRDEVAQRSLATERPGAQGDRAGEKLVGAVRDQLDVVSAILIEDYHRLIHGRDSAIHQATWISFAAVGVIALQILVYGFLAGRLRGELVRERRVVAVLQRAFTSEIVIDPRLDVGATYLSATRGATVGGDVYDIFPLDAQRTLIVIADVSGKGVEAAIDSTFVKYSLRAYASEYVDAATIVSRFNALYDRSGRAPEAFVVLFVAIVDHAARVLHYVNAGHEAAFIRRRDRIEQLAPTGPIIGIASPADYAAADAHITPDDLLFLATDGLTEARDASGTFLSAAGVQTWLSQAQSEGAQGLVDDVARRLRRYTRDRSSDDLAIMAVRLRG
jgi:CHASE3 domain sensor protein